MRWLFPGQEIQIESRCLDCGEPIIIRMKDDILIDVDPPSAVGYSMSPFAQWRAGSNAFN